MPTSPGAWKRAPSRAARCSNASSSAGDPKVAVNRPPRAGVPIMPNEVSRSLSFCILLILVVAIALLPGPPAWSDEQQTLHILVVADTADPLVGNGCLADFKTVIRYFSETTNI